MSISEPSSGPLEEHGRRFQVSSKRILPLPFAPVDGVPSTAGKDRLQIEYSTASARREQGALYNTCFRKDDGQVALPWRYDGCPHGQTIAPIARNAGGELVASYACSPRKVVFRGEVVGTVGQVGDVMTAPGLRSSGVFTDLHWNAMEESWSRGWAGAWGLPNKFSGHIFFNKLGWKHAGHIGPWNFVLRTDPKARVIRLQNGRLAAWGTSWAAWRGARTRTQLSVPGWSVQDLEEIPLEVADISREVERGFDWMVHRDAEYLQWRYLRAPSGLFRAIGLRDRSGACLGYAIVQLPRVGESLGFIVDLLGVSPQAEGALLDAALGRLARSDAAVVRAYAMRGSHWEGLLARGGFRKPRGYKEVGAYALDPGSPLARSTVDTSSWYFMDGDRDDETAR